MTPHLDDGDVRIWHGDALEQLALMPSESVHCAITSPPFYSLRDYGVDGQIGLEATLDEWLASLVAVFTELKRVLRSDGVFFCEIGDSYIDKQLAGAPWRLAFALQEAGWFLRSDIVWARSPPNPMPESVTDRPTKAHSYVFLLTKSARYFYDADAIREEITSEASIARNRSTPRQTRGAGSHQPGGSMLVREVAFETANGRNARSVWSIPTEPTPFAHFATFPQALVERCIKAGTSEHGCCSECGAPWRRITEISGGTTGKGWHDHTTDAVTGQVGGTAVANGMKDYRREHLGWEPSCACPNKWTDDFGRIQPWPTVPCVVLDPFMGSGTTALVARRLGRHAWGVELNAEYLDIAAKRLQQLSLLA